MTLGKIADPSAITPLLRALESTDEKLVSTSWLSLLKLLQDGLPVLDYLIPVINKYFSNRPLSNGYLASIDRYIDLLVQLLVLCSPTPGQLSALRPVLLAVTLLTDRFQGKKLETIRKLLNESSNLT